MKFNPAIFTGDVLNTTARIEELCNTYGERLLVSKNLLDMLQIENRYVKKPIAETMLRGKKTKSVLYNLEKLD